MPAHHQLAGDDVQPQDSPPARSGPGWPRHLAFGLAGPALVVLAWFAASGSSRTAASVLPPPHTVLAAVASEVVSGALFRCPLPGRLEGSACSPESR